MGPLLSPKPFFLHTILLLAVLLEVMGLETRKAKA
jgi:hypothetical protein